VSRIEGNVPHLWAKFTHFVGYLPTNKHAYSYEEAQTEAVQLILSITSNNAADYNIKGELLEDLENPEEALDAYKQAIKLDSKNIDAYRNAAELLVSLGRYKVALAVYDQAIQLSPENITAYNGKGQALNGLQLYDEALAVYNQAIQLNPSDHELADLYCKKGATLRLLGRSEEALAAYEQAESLEKASHSNFTTSSEAHRGIREIRREEHPRLYKLYSFTKILSINSSNFWRYLTVAAIIFIYVLFSKIIFLELLTIVFTITILYINIITIITKKILKED
jgi:tetratricopeptide (TPR) repeat protein